jgi:hypothetical protein
MRDLLFCNIYTRIGRRHLLHVPRNSNKNSLTLLKIEQIENGERKTKWGAKKSSSNRLRTQEEEEIENGEGDLPTRGAGSTSQGRRNSTGEQGRSSAPASRDGCSSPVSGGSSPVAGGRRADVPKGGCRGVRRDACGNAVRCEAEPRLG